MNLQTPFPGGMMASYAAFRGLLCQFLVITMLVGLSGCATTFKTPSGEPEVTINSADRDKIKGLIINEFMNHGFVVEKESGFQITFSRQMSGMQGLSYQVLLGNAQSSTPEWSATISMATVGGQTRVMARATTRMQNAFGREDVLDMTHEKAGRQLMDLLEKVKRSIESQ